LALLSAGATLLGWILIALKKNPSDRFIAITLLLVAGAMLTVSALQLIPSALDSGLNIMQVLLTTGLGFTVVVLLSSVKFDKDASKVKNPALLITIALSLHNLPEGAAPIGATLVDIQTGLTTSLVLALHNIPEGIAISATALLAGYSRKMALLLTLAATLAEALGAFAVYMSGSLLLDDRSVGLLLSAVAGIMIAICAKELIPYSVKTLYKKK
jgi:ZIP family zinc transporter